MNTCARLIARHGLLLVFWFATLSVASDVHCKMKPGCIHSTQCDPVPKRWSGTAYDVEKYLFNKEFPITCSINEIHELRNEFKKEIDDLKIENEMMKEASDISHQNHNREIGVLKAENKKLEKSLNEIQQMQQTLNQEYGDLKAEKEILKGSSNTLGISNGGTASLMTEYKKLEKSMNLFKEKILLESSILKFENEILKESLEKAHEKLNRAEEKLDKLNEKFPRMMTSAISDKTVANCDLEYNGKCFRAIVRDANEVNFTTAETMCKDGWKLANIYSRNHYDRLAIYLRTKLAPETYTSAWIGMAYDVNANQIYLSDGNRFTEELPWYPGWPRGDSSHNKLTTYFVLDSGSRYQGMVNYPATAKRRGVLCEI